MRVVGSYIKSARCIICNLAFAIYFVACYSNNALAYDGQKFGNVCGQVLSMLQGGFGSMLTAAAGVGAIIASAAGGFKVAWALIVVSVGSFILKAYVELFFAPCS